MGTGTLKLPVDCKKENMRIIGAVSATVPTNFFRSLGDHEYEQTHAPEDFDYDQAVTDIQAAIVLKADQTDLDTTNTLLTAKAGQADMVTVQTQLGEVETFKNNADDYFDFTNRLIRDSHTEACIVKNLRVLATDDYQNNEVHHEQFHEGENAWVDEETIPDPGLKGCTSHKARAPSS